MQENEKIYRPNALRGMFSTRGIVPLLIALIIINIGSEGMFLVAILLIFFVAFLFIYLNLKAQSYELRRDGILVKKGIFSKTNALILYSQIQDVQELQGIFETFLGVGNLKIVTMSQSTLPMKLASLNKSEMGEIKNYILNVAKMSEKDVQVHTEPEKISEEPLYKIHTVKKFITITLAIFVAFTILFVLSLFIGGQVFNTLFALSSFIGGQAFTTLIFSPYMIVFGLICVIIIGGTFFLRSILEQISFRLQLNENSVIIGSEFFSRRFTNLPYDKFQDIGLSKDMFDRLLHMAGIKIETGETTIPFDKNQIILNSISSLYEKDALELRSIVLKNSGIRNFMTETLREKFPLQKIKPLKKSVSFTFWLFVAIGIMIVILYPLLPTFRNILLISLALPAIIFPIKLIYEIYYFRSYFYSGNSEILILRKGVFTIKEVTVPYDKIQNVFVNQDMFDRIFGLYDVHLPTVGSISQMELHIDGVSKDTTESLKTMLLNRIS